MSGMPKGVGRTRIKPDWQASNDDKAFADAQGVDWQVVEPEFHDYHLAHGTLMLDWHAAWRTWVRNQVRFGRATGQRNLPILAVIQGYELTA